MDLPNFRHSELQSKQRKARWGFHHTYKHHIFGCWPKIVFFIEMGNDLYNNQETFSHTIETDPSSKICQTSCQCLPTCGRPNGSRIYFWLLNFILTWNDTIFNNTIMTILKGVFLNEVYQIFNVPLKTIFWQWLYPYWWKTQFQR